MSEKTAKADMGEEIRSGIGKALKTEFGGEYPIYSEEVKQGMTTPCFFISCVEASQQRFLSGRFLCENKFLIRFYPKDDSRKKQQCFQTAQRLFDCLLWIKAGEDLLMGRKMSGRTENGILSFYVNYDYFGYKKEDKTPMGELTENVRAKR